MFSNKKTNQQTKAQKMVFVRKEKCRNQNQNELKRERDFFQDYNAKRNERNDITG